MSTYDPAGVMGDINRKQQYDNGLRRGLGLPTSTPSAPMVRQPIQRPAPNPFQSMMMRFFGSRAKKEGLK